MATTPPYKDGQIYVTNMPTEVLATLLVTLHETKHKPAPEGVPQSRTGNLSEPEEELYDALVREATARTNDTIEQRKEKTP